MALLEIRNIIMDFDGFHAIYDMVDSVPDAVQRFAEVPTREA